MIKSITAARKYVKNIKRGLIENPFANKDCIGALKVFAEAKDEENFRIVVDFMANFISKTKESGFKLFKKEPLTFVESLVMLIDHGGKANYFMFQRARGLKIKKLSIGKTQRFFQKLYGSHFFVR